jgi:hypothetical protein
MLATLTLGDPVHFLFHVVLPRVVQGGKQNSLAIADRMPPRCITFARHTVEKLRQQQLNLANRHGYFPTPNAIHAANGTTHHVSLLELHG